MPIAHSSYQGIPEAEGMSSTPHGSHLIELIQTQGKNVTGASAEGRGAGDSLRSHANHAAKALSGPWHLSRCRE